MDKKESSNARSNASAIRPHLTYPCTRVLSFTVNPPGTRCTTAKLGTQTRLSADVNPFAQTPRIFTILQLNTTSTLS